MCRSSSSPTAAFRERIELDVDLDTSEIVSGVKPKPVPAALNRKLTAWLESHSLSAPEVKSAEGDPLREKLVAMAERMLTDGLSKVSTPRSFFWQMNVVVVKSGENWQATYLDYGKWHDLPTRYGLIELLPALLPLMKSRKARYEINIWKTGEVFVDKGNELTLKP